MIFTCLPAFSFRYDLRWPYLSLREERYGRKTRQRAPKPPFGIRFYTGDRRGDVRNLHVFAVMQFTRFRPVRGVLRTASTDSCVLRQLRPNHWHFMNNQRSLLSEVGWFWLCVRLLGHPKTFPEGKVPTESAEEGMRRKLAIEEPTETARLVTFFPLPSAQVLPPSPWGKVLSGVS